MKGETKWGWYKTIILIWLYITILELTVDASCTDTHGYLSDGVTINSPAYPAYYPYMQSCTWNLSVPIGFEINIESFSYDIEPSSDCSFDYLTIFDGVSRRSAPKAHLCGQDTYPGTTSTGRNLFIAFDSDDDENYGGFQFQLSMIGMKRFWIWFWH